MLPTSTNIISNSRRGKRELPKVECMASMQAEKSGYDIVSGVAQAEIRSGTVRGVAAAKLRWLFLEGGCRLEA